MITRFRGTLGYKILLWFVFLLGLVVVGSWTSSILLSPEVLKNDDFVQYWSAGRLNVLRANPYDPEQLRPLQYATGRTDYVTGAVTIVWNPPWTMPLLMVFGVWSYPVARTLWFMSSFALLAVCSARTWRWYGGPERLQWIAWVVAFTFMPALVMLRVGQIGVFLFAGMVGVLSAATKRQWVRLGVWVILLSIKPQLVYLLLVVLLLWLIERYQFVPVISGMVVLVLFIGVALFFNPMVVRQYVEALAAYPPVAWATPTLGSVLRLIFGVDRVWLPLLPTFSGFIWAVLYWRRRRHIWDWGAELPLLLFVSLLTTLYTWTYDLVLLVFPIVALLACWWRQKTPGKLPLFLLAYCVLSVMLLVVQSWGLNDFWFMWVSPVLLVWYLWARMTVSVKSPVETPVMM